jgi:general secretion pathway protein K
MNDRGMVLITVLWIVLVLAFISLSLAAAARVEVNATQDSFDSERAFFLAKSAAEVMFLNMQKPDTLTDAPIKEEKGIYTFSFDSGEARVRMESNSGLIDINEASDEILSSMFESLGIETVLRNELVDSILDWRDVDDVPRLYGAEIDNYGQVIIGPRRLPGNTGFGTIEELLLVKHMTPQIFYGRVETDSEGQSYHRIPGLRELVTLHSGSSQVDVNHASPDVMAALPHMNRDLVTRIIAERSEKLFENTQDLVTRIPELLNSGAAENMSTDSGVPTSIVSTASVQPSGAMRTVRLDFVRERTKQIISTVPLMYKEVEVIQSGRWRY